MDHGLYGCIDSVRPGRAVGVSAFATGGANWPSLSTLHIQEKSSRMNTPQKGTSLDRKPSRTLHISARLRECAYEVHLIHWPRTVHFPLETCNMWSRD